MNLEAVNESGSIRECAYPHWHARDVKVWALRACHRNKIGNAIPMRAHRNQTLSVVEEST